MSIHVHSFTPSHFDDVIALGNGVHGDNYLDQQSLQALYEKGWQHDINASFVAVDVRNQKVPKLVGFRITLAAGNWQLDKWCSPELWQCDSQSVCYFKSNTIDPEYRSKGIGKTLLLHSISACAKQGANAGLAHIWLASPKNSAFGYFSACGGKLVKKHPNKWQSLSLQDGYICPICGHLCTCTAAEMLLTFDQLEHV